MTKLRGELLGRPLSIREYSALAEYARGGTVKDAATALGLSTQTIKNHLAVARQKLGAENTIEALAAAGWLQVPDPGDEPELAATAVAAGMVAALRKAADDLEAAL